MKTLSETPDSKNRMAGESRHATGSGVELGRLITVCYLIDNLNMAGTENHLVGLIRTLDRTRFSPILVLLDGENQTSRRLEPANCTVYRLGIRSFYHPSVISRSRRFIKILQQHRIDILQMHFPDSTLFGSILGKFAGVGCMIRTRRNAGYATTRVQRLCGRLISRIVKKTIANNEACRDSVIEQEHADPDSVEIIRNGIDLDCFRYQALRSRRSVNRVGMLANLRPVKRPEEFVRAAAVILKNCDDCEFVVGGDGPMRMEIEALVRDLGLTRHFQLLGGIEDVAGYISKLDVLVSCSSSEGLSNTLLEAMAMGVPVVATNIPGNRSIVDGETTGLLYQLGNIDELAETICRILSDDHLADSIRKTANDMVQSRFSRERMLRNYEDFYLRILYHGSNSASV